MIHATEYVTYELWSVTVMGTPGNYLISTRAFLIVIRGTVCSPLKVLIKLHSYNTVTCSLVVLPLLREGFCLSYYSEITGSEAMNIFSFCCSLPVLGITHQIKKLSSPDRKVVF